MYKCSDAILSILGDTDQTYEPELVEKVIKWIEDQKVAKDVPIRKKKSKKQKQKDKKKKTPGNPLLGRMSGDVKFLQDFVNFQSSQTLRTAYTVSKFKILDL